MPAQLQSRCTKLRRCSQASETHLRLSITIDTACRQCIHLRQPGLCWSPPSWSEHCSMLANASDCIGTLF